MRYDNPVLRDMLAGEYVLGMLRGRARDRFQRLLATDRKLQRSVNVWQKQLTSLSEETRSVTPPARVFLAIKTRLEAAPVQVRPRWWQRLGFWHAVSAGATVLALALAVLLGNIVLRPAPVPAGPSYVALLQDVSARPALVLTAYNKPTWHLDIEMLAEPGVSPGQVMQVWAIARDTGATQPLVTLATSRVQRIALSEAAWKLVKGSEFLVVTLEPVGSPAPGPSGSLLYRGYCINLKGMGAT